MKPTVRPIRRFFADTLDNVFAGIFCFILILILSVFLEKSSTELCLKIFNAFFVIFYAPSLISSAWKATLGQKCLRMNVCSLDVERLTFRQAFWRQVVQYGILLSSTLSFGIIVLVGSFLAGFLNAPEIVSLILIAMLCVLFVVTNFMLIYVRFFNNGRQTAVDYYSDTLVVYADS